MSSGRTRQTRWSEAARDREFPARDRDRIDAISAGRARRVPSARRAGSGDGMPPRCGSATATNCLPTEAEVRGMGLKAPPLGSRPNGEPQRDSHGQNTGAERRWRGGRSVRGACAAPSLELEMLSLPPNWPGRVLVRTTLRTTGPGTVVNSAPIRPTVVSRSCKRRRSAGSSGQHRVLLASCG